MIASSNSITVAVAVTGLSSCLIKHKFGKKILKEKNSNG